MKKLVNYVCKRFIISESISSRLGVSARNYYLCLDALYKGEENNDR